MNWEKQREWDVKFLRLAEHISTWSKDPSTKTGAVIVNGERHVVSMGYNGFPQRMPDANQYYANRDEKYSRIVHCEVNALIFARRDVTGCTLYTWPFLSCDRCFVMLAQAGIARFVAPVVTHPDHLERWEPVFERTRGYAHEMGITLDEIDL
jgi:dCMP deaminase